MEPRKSRPNLYLYALLSCIHLAASDDGSQVSQQKRLLQHLLNPTRYDKGVRPVRFNSNVTHVHLNVSIQNVVDMDHFKQALKVNTLIAMKWDDEFLTWNSSDYDGLSYFIVPSDNVWIPAFISGKNATHYLHEGTKTSVRVDSKGNVVMHQTKQLQAHCTSTVDGFSSVLYYCTVILIPWNYKGSEVNIHGAIDVAGLHNASWDASHIDMHLNGGTLPFMEFSFMLKRKYETSWDRPTAAVVIITLVIFWLPSSPPKITLGGVSLLLTTFLIDSVTKEFTGSSNVPPIVTFLCHCTILTTASLLCAVVTLKLLHNSHACQPPRCLMRLLDGRLGSLLLVGDFKLADRQTEMMAQLTENASPVVERVVSRRREWQAVARAADRVLFFLFATSFVTLRLYDQLHQNVLHV
ncbi:unnamed protein product [Ixodes pacificus]